MRPQRCGILRAGRQTRQAAPCALRSHEEHRMCLGEGRHGAWKGFTRRAESTSSTPGRLARSRQSPRSGRCMPSAVPVICQDKQPACQRWRRSQGSSCPCDHRKHSGWQPRNWASKWRDWREIIEGMGAAYDFPALDSRLTPELPAHRCGSRASLAATLRPFGGRAAPGYACSVLG